MTEEKMFSNTDLRRLIIPLIIEQVLAVTVGMADTMMVASAGEAAISGVSLVDMLNMLLINIFASLATGGAVVCSQFIGAQQREKACNAAKQLLFIGFLLSTLLMALCLIFRLPLLRLFFGNIEPDVMKNAATYLWISALSYPFLSVYNSGAALFRAMGNSKVSMVTSIYVNILNVAGNALLIYGFHLGVAGAAISSLVSRAVGAVVMVVLLNNPLHPIHVLVREKFRPSLAMIKTILHIGVPNALEGSMFQLGRVLVVSIISTFGTVQIAANAVANTFDSLGCIPGQSINLAMLAVIGQCIGAGSLEQVKYYTKKLMKITYLITIGLILLIFATLPLTFQLYHNISREALELAALLVLIHNGCAMLIWPLSFTLPNALKASNDVRFTMVVSIFSMWIFRIVFSFVIGNWLGLGAIGVWIAMVLDWIFRSICFVWRFISGKWKKYSGIVQKDKNTDTV